MEKISSRIPKAVLSFIPFVLYITLQELDTIGGYSACLWYKILVCAAPIACLSLPCFVKYTKGETYFLIAVMIFWLIGSIRYYIL